MERVTALGTWGRRRGEWLDLEIVGESERQRSRKVKKQDKEADRCGGRGGAPAFEEEREATRCRGSGGDLCRSKRVRSHASAASERQSARVTIAERAIGAQVGDTGAFSPF